MSIDKRGSTEEPAPGWEPVLPPAGLPGDEPPEGHSPLLPDATSGIIIGAFAVVAALIVAFMWTPYHRNLHITRSFEAFNAGQWSVAIPDYEYLTKMDPNDVARRINLAWCYVETGQWARALELYQYIAKKDPAQKLDDRIGLCEVELGNLREAQASLAQAVARDRDNPISNYAMGRLLLLEGDARNASVYFQAAARSHEWDERAKPYRNQIADKILSAALPTTPTLGALPPPRPAPSPAPRSATRPTTAGAARSGR